MLVLAAFAWDGMPKRLAICVCLALLSGIFLILPGLSNRISLPLLAVYLCFVPKKIFVRMEIPVHDTSRIMDGVVPLTIAFILCVWLLFFIFTQSSAVALGAGSGFFLIVFLTEYYIWKFRGDFLMPSDLKAAGTAMSVMDNYDYTLSPEALYSVIYFLFFVAAGSRIRICMRRWIHVAVSLAAVLFIGGWYYIVMDTENPLGKEFVINYWLMAAALPNGRHKGIEWRLPELFSSVEGQQDRHPRGILPGDGTGGCTGCGGGIRETAGGG